ESERERYSDADGGVSREPCSEGEEKSGLTSLGLRRRCDRRFASRGRIYAKKKSRKPCSFPTVSAGGRIERRQFSANRGTRARLVKASGFSSRPEHWTRSDRDGGLCRIAARHSNLAGRAGQEKQVRPLAPFQWIHGGDQRWSARRRRSL